MEKMRVGIVGVGMRGKYAFAELLSQNKNVEITAFCDINPVRLESAALKYKVEKTYLDFAEMLKSEKFDGVIITTPDYLHEQHVCMALEAGVNVLVDKPLAINVNACQHILATAEKSRKTVMIGFNLRHHVVLRKLKKMIEEGLLGRIFIAENREFYNGGRTYMARWNGQKKNTGSLWIHKGSHDFDIFDWLLDFPKPVKVSAFARVDVLTPENIPFELKPGVKVGPSCSKCPYLDVCPDKAPYNLDDDWSDKASAFDGYVKDMCIYTNEKDTHDNGIAMVEYENGVKVSHFECFITSFDDRLYTFVGTRGMVQASLAQNKITFYPRWSKDVVTYELKEEAGSHGGADPGLVEKFINVIAGRDVNSSTAIQGMWSSAIGEAAELSRTENRTVFIDELFKK